LNQIATDLKGLEPDDEKYAKILVRMALITLKTTSNTT
jgi:hypothetical protein